MKEVYRQGRTVSCTNKDIQVDISENSQIEPDINRDVIPTPSYTKIDSYGNDQIEITPEINVNNIQAGPSTKNISTTQSLPTAKRQIENMRVDFSKF
ncbi:Hypothetical protein CINCED_3A004922 [Cinara cedri]|uniref:Uncharacterized protein n=1 Tax=Cinara cedri TaxID=506608 RepID=A0A5E4MSF6_9HEMI|nr:Hypothetical protein CINCED_3A004922 [Cinara cedri]